MREYNKICPEVTDFDNLHEAWRKARRGKHEFPALYDP